MCWLEDVARSGACNKLCRYALWGTLVQALEQSLGISSDRQVLDLLLHLPLSRELESEADEIALVLMSKVIVLFSAVPSSFFVISSLARHLTYAGLLQPSCCLACIREDAKPEAITT